MLSFYPEKGLQLFTIKINIIVDGESIGHYLLIPHSLHMYELHQSPLDKKYRGHAVEINSRAMRYVFANMKNLQKLFATIPINNRLAISLAKKCGFKKEGHLSKSYMLDEVMIDQEIYGISKEDVLCQ